MFILSVIKRFLSKHSIPFITSIKASLKKDFFVEIMYYRCSCNVYVNTDLKGAGTFLVLISILFDGIFWFQFLQKVFTRSKT